MFQQVDLEKRKNELNHEPVPDFCQNSLPKQHPANERCRHFFGGRGASVGTGGASASSRSVVRHFSYGQFVGTCTSAGTSVDTR